MTDTEVKEVEETEEKEETKEEVKEEKKETPKKTEVKTDERGMVECPECYLDVKESNLGSHMYKAHGIDRRAVPEIEKDGEKNLTPPEKLTPIQKREQKPADKHRKDGMSKLWFGDRN
jgi:hypothetical protein